MPTELTTTAAQPEAGAAEGGSGIGVSGGMSRQDIEHIRNTDFDRYEREGLSNKLVSMDRIERGDVVSMAAPEARSQMESTAAGRELVQSWMGTGGFEPRLKELQQNVSAAIRDIGDTRAQRVFVERFDRAIPQDAQYAVYEVISTRAPDYPEPATADEVEQFRQDPVAGKMADRWGDETPAKLARIMWRVDRLQEMAGEIGPLMQWYETLTEREARAFFELASR
jgi:hypothetical protein